MDQKEFRIARGSSVRQYIRQFSATEKVVFGIFVVAALLTAIIMAAKVNNYFLVKTPAYGGELREGVVGLPRAINPVLAVSEVDRDISSLIYAGLMKYQDGSIVPDLAESYSMSNDGLTYSFKLKKNIKFQDGQAVTADDVIFTIQKIQDIALKSPRRADWVNVTARALSPSEVEFVLKQPYSPFITNATIGIIPKHVWGKISNDQFIFSEYNSKPIGAGPYKIASVSHDQNSISTIYKLSAWSDYQGKKPYIKNISFVFFSDEEKALNSLDAGTIDSLASISAVEGARLASDSAQAYKIIRTPLPRIFGVFFNQSQSPVLSDKTIRQALEMSVDRQAIVKSALSGYGTPIYGPLPLGIIAASTTKTAERYNANFEDAMTLLEKNGWKKNSGGIYEKKMKSGIITLSFDIYTADAAELKQTAELLKNNWAVLGARVSVKVFEASDFYQNIIRTRKYGALLFGELIGKDRDVYAFWHSSQRNAPGLNVALYANSSVDKVLENIRNITDEKTKLSKYAELDKLIQDDIPAIFLYAPDFIYAIPKKLRGIELGSITTSNDRWNSISDWYVITEKVWKIFTKK